MEARAWTIVNGTKAPQAAGKIPVSYTHLKDSEAYFKQKNASALPNKPKVLYLQNKNLTVAGNKSCLLYTSP